MTRSAVLLGPFPAPAAASRFTPSHVATETRRLIPGLLLCLAVTLLAAVLQAAEHRLFGRAWLESLVLAILAGAVIRTCWTPGERWRPGIEFSAKMLLEIAVVLLGASVSAATILSAGLGLLAGIAGVVVIAIAISYGLGRGLGLSHRMATLVACGNSICGNSAIAAVAPVIGADGEDVASAIAFTAVLGVAAVLGLPLLGGALHMGALPFGALAGLTVYAVPQVLAATAPMGATAIQVGTLVKLVRVLMLGPVCFVLSLLSRRLRAEADETAPEVTAGDRPAPGAPAAGHATRVSLVPWFILGFLALIGLRSLGLVPTVALGPMATTASLLTIVSMAALGLGADMRVVARAGGRVTAAVTLSLLALGSISFGLIHLLNLH